MSGSRFLRDGARLRLHDTGGSGRSIVFQHGLGGNEAQVRQNFPDDSGWRRVTLDCRAQGLSEAGETRPFRLAMFADDVLAAADAAGLDRFAAGGISTGAAIALMLAHRCPERVSALILVRPSWAFEPAPANMAPFVEVAQLLRTHGPAEGRRLFEASPTAEMLRREGPDNLKSLLGLFERDDTAVTADLLEGIATDGPGVSRKAAAELRMPTLVVGNALDHVHPPAYATEIAVTIPQAIHVHAASKALDAAAHFAEVKAAIRAFLAGLDPDRSSP
ncbi:alpha/beta fold hydrolase [Aureimonas leprariae]|uniref:Alpha/beta hydrolase n=1 Tax=Plantimonas leprariae TaxID=2615207 RepID=A0A7V7PTH0_9HYPH|nr:alpha/beta hydrolase [Aureimonas leprariae]KAB0682948.1 alpha/beta hydrolase [Aureimonas leprariae]